VKRKRFPVEQIVAIRQAGSQCCDLTCSTTAGELTSGTVTEKWTDQEDEGRMMLCANDAAGHESGS